MKVGILSVNRRLYSTRRLWETSRKRGHDVRFLDPRRCAVSWLPQGPALTQGGLKMEGMDVVIPRIGTSVTETGLIVLRQLEAEGVITPNCADAIEQSRDKVRSIQRLSHSGIPVPPSLFVDIPEEIDGCVDLLGGLPVIVKLLRGTQGVGVIKVGEMDQLRSTVETLWNLGERILLQRFVAESEGRDLRLFVVGDRVVAAMERESQPGEFRSNLHRGGKGTNFRPDEELQDVALRAARCMGLGIAGVDVLLSEQGPLVLEVNSSPGLEGIEAATGRDVAKAIVKYLETLPAGQLSETKVDADNATQHEGC